MPVVMVYLVVLGLVGSLGLTILNRVEQRLFDMYEVTFQHDVIALSKAHERFVIQYSRAPVSLAELISAPGNQDLSDIDLNRVGYSTEPFTANGFTYSKSLIWHKRYNTFLSDTEVLENNQAGTNDFDEAGAFKAPSIVYWYQSSTLSNLSKLKAAIYTQLDESAQRIVHSVNTLPVETNSSGTLSLGDSLTLASAVGYTGTFLACTGVFTFDGAPLTCSDLFAVDGTPIYYQLVSDSVAVLSVESSNLKSESGNSIFLFTHVLVSAS